MTDLDLTAVNAILGGVVMLVVGLLLLARAWRGKRDSPEIIEARRFAQALNDDLRARFPDVDLTTATPPRCRRCGVPVRLSRFGAWVHDGRPHCGRPINVADLEFGPVPPSADAD